MKAIVCEMCGSKDLIKQDGEYVCQNCGTKYTIEEARKLMVEVDNTQKMANLYERARKSLEVGDIEHISEYYKEILDNQPKDWEAYFYTYLYEYPTFKNGEAWSVGAKLGRTIPSAYDMAVEDCSPEEATDRIVTITKKVTDRLIGIANTGVALLRQYEQTYHDMYNRMRPTTINTIANCLDAFSPIEKKCEEIINSHDEIDKEKCRDALLYLCMSRYKLSDLQFEPYIGLKERLFQPYIILGYAKKVHELDPSFVVPSTESKTNPSGCYVATAVYGSYDCPQVWTLRRYRDYTLSETWYGRAFVHTYYAISPTLVKWFGHTDWFKKMWRGRLDRMVNRLNSEGVENTPYQDRQW